MTTDLQALSVTSPARLAALTKPEPLPDPWVERIFQVMEGRYMALFLDRVRGCDLANVKRQWAEELAGFADKPHCIAYALDSLADSQYVPTLPEFKAACRRAPPLNNVHALPHKLSPEDLERNRSRLAEMMAGLQKAKAFPG